MLQLTVDKGINKLVLYTSDPTIHNFLEATKDIYDYNCFTKSWGFQKRSIRIYDNTPRSSKMKDGTYKYVIGLGWTAYVLGVLKNYISQKEYDDILKEVILSDTYRVEPFPELRDYQNSDILFLLKYKIGLMVVNTGYGKTQSIATLTNYARSLGKKVLLVTPGSKARDELVKRCKSLFNLDVSCSDQDITGELDCIMTSGLLNSGKYKIPEKKKQFEKLLSGYDWVLVDEVEYTINKAGEFMFDHCTGADHFYGFSGTADKYNAKMLTFSNGLQDETIFNNTHLIKHFGPALIYRLPLNISITRVSIRTKAMSPSNINLTEEEIDESSNVYFTIMNRIWTNEKICKALVKVIKKYRMPFIPINNLNFIIDDWISNYFIGTFRILLVSGVGYTYYDLSGNKTLLSLQEACNYIKDGKVDVIPSTSAGYRALDFPGLTNIILTAGKVAGTVLQSVGRVARGEHMNIITLDPYSSKVKIPVYSKGAVERDKMIKDYYKYCNIEEVIELEEDL